MGNYRNLNDPRLIEIDDRDSWRPTRPHSVEVEDWECTTGSNAFQIAAHFDRLQERLIECIARAGAVVGCIAWMTSIPILEALSKKDFVSILVQKEDFLRPDLNKHQNGWKGNLRRLYNALPVDRERHMIDGEIVHRLSVCCCPGLDAVRCVGFAGNERSRPRMHHKFLVFCATLPDYKLLPMSVWTGSYNFSDMANNSLENAVVIHSCEIARQYYREWEYVFALSEPLDWEHEYCEPEYRIGT